MRGAFPLLLAVACLAATSAARAEDPIQFFERLMGPPARTMERALAPRRAPARRSRTAPAVAPQPPATADLVAIPMPRLRPADAGRAALGYTPATAIGTAPLVPEPRVRPPAASPPLHAPPPAARSTCGVMLARLGVEARPLPPFHDGACGIPAPVSISGFDGGAVAVSTKALLDCSFAEALAAWLADTVEPIAQRTLGGKLTGLRIAASYACRNRDSLADAKLSEHARGNAIDISAFRVAGIGWIDVTHGWTGGGAKAAFLRKVRASACGPFTTVLGPGSDSYHATHFHLDRIKRHTAGPSHGLYCH